MVDNRRGYAGLVLLSLLLLFWTEHLFFLLACILEILLPVVLFLALRAELRFLSVDWTCPDSCTMGQPLELALSVTRSRGPFAGGLLRARVSCGNVMFRQTVTDVFEIKASGRTGCLAVGVPTKLCGKRRFRCESLELYDLFGLCCLKLPLLPERSVMVYPAEVSLELELQEPGESGWEYTQDTAGRRGDDPSELFDMRDYQAGDDVRSIHWKLSAKTSSLLVRSFCDTVRYDTLVLVDAAVKRDGGEPAAETAAACIALGSSVSRKLTRQGVLHGLAFTSDCGLSDELAADPKQLQQVLEPWMCMQLPEKNGLGIRYLKLCDWGLGCGKLLYITTENCPDDISFLPPEMEVTVVCVTGRGELADTMKTSYGWLVNLPVRWMERHTCRLSL